MKRWAEPPHSSAPSARSRRRSASRRWARSSSAAAPPPPVQASEARRPSWSPFSRSTLRLRRPACWASWRCSSLFRFESRTSSLRRACAAHRRDSVNRAPRYRCTNASLCRGPWLIRAAEQRLDLLAQHVELERLREVVVAARRKGFAAVVAGGQDDHAQAAAAILGGTRELQAVHARHPNIGDDELGAAC